MSSAGFQPHHVVQVNEGVIDGHNIDLSGLESGTGYQAANTTKSAIKSQYGHQLDW